jgi:DNA-binding CsgD family transcriptional regulator
MDTARRLNAMPAERRAGVYTGEMLVGQPDYRTEFFNDFAMRHRIPRMMPSIVPVVSSESYSGVTGLTILRRRRDLPFGSSDLPLLRMLFPHIRRALEVRSRLRGAADAIRMSKDLIALLPIPAMVVDRSARVLCANRRAQLLLAQCDALATRAGCLVAHASSDTSRLRSACAGAAGRRFEHGRMGATMAIRRRSSPEFLRLMVSPMTPADPLSIEVNCACALVLVDEPAATSRPNAELLARLYGLTRAEGDIAARIGAGDSLDHIAAVRGCSLQTVQWHNKRILSKMGCTSRSQLVRRVTMNLASVVDTDS